MARRMRAAASGQTTALVRPPRFAGGGGAALPFGSGTPGLPDPASARGKMLARQWRDDARGRFTERDFCMPDSGGVLPATTSAQQSIKVVSNRTSFVRLVAMRGSIVWSANADGGENYLPELDEANMRLLLQIDGEESAMTNGQGQAYASYGDLFTTSAPWYWFAAPPRLRVDDTIAATWMNTYGTNGVPSENTLWASLTLRLVDDAWWQSLYGT